MKDSFLEKKIFFIREKFKEYLPAMNQWFIGTPERSLLEAYEAAQRIKNIEIEHFAGQKISPESANFSENVMAYWQVELEKNLIIIKLRLTEFQISFSFSKSFNTLFLEKLKFIDEVLDKYSQKQTPISSGAIAPNSQQFLIKDNKASKQPKLSNLENMRVVPAFDKTGVIPRSIGRTFNKIQADLSPQAEEQFVKNFQLSRNRTRIAIKFLLLLVIIPLLAQSLSKPFINIAVEGVRGEQFTPIFLNYEMEEEALTELRSFEEKLKFQTLIHQSPSLSSEAIKEQVKHKAHEIAKEFQEKSNDAISNVFADLISLIAFVLVIVTSQRDIVVVKAFMDNIIYGLSDSAKAFLIILFTDIFVGFHSPHGWEVILEGLAEHLGLPADESLISLFIATFPVILDTIVKYWIFRYLSRLSPSALATLKEMNE